MEPKPPEKKLKTHLPSEAFNRFFTNKLEDYKETTSAIITSDLKKKCHTEIKQIVSMIEKGYIPTKERDPSVYTGLGGIALMFLRLHTQGDSDQPYLKKGAAYLERASSLCDDTDPVTFFCGVGGIFALQAVYSSLLEDKTASNKAIEELKNLRKQALKEKNNELLYGKAGYLYAILFVNSYIKDAIPLSWGEPVVTAIIRDGQREGTSHGGSPLMWNWDRTRYLGAAHGLVGILYILLQFPLTSDQRTKVLGSVRYLLHGSGERFKTRFPSGNLGCVDNSAKTIDEDYLVHWCHGSPGLTFLLTKAWEQYKSSETEGASDTKEILNELRKEALATGDIIWERGLLKKGIGLCHGVTGNAYSFLNLWKTFSDTRSLFRARSFAEFAIDNWRKLTEDSQMSVPDRPYSLMEGAAGPVCFYLDLLQPDRALFPAFEA